MATNTTVDSPKQRVHVSLTPATLDTIARDARAANRTLSQQIEHVYGRLASGPERLVELEALAASKLNPGEHTSMSDSSKERGDAAAQAHLRNHANGMRLPPLPRNDGPVTGNIANEPRPGPGTTEFMPRGRPGTRDVPGK
jgi:hypothetical protein